MALEQVEQALAKAGRKHFFQTNSFISRELAPADYEDYADLAACTLDDVFIEIGDSISRKKVCSTLTELVKAGLVRKKQIGSLSLFWLKGTQYLKK